jgi:hypothetical protein
MNSPTTRPTVTQRLAQKRDAERRKAEEEYARLVQLLADGREPAEAAVARCLEVLGRTPEQLDQAAGVIRHRRALRAELADVPKLRREAAALRAEMDGTLRALGEAQERHNQTVGRCYNRAQDLDRQAAATQERVARELERTAPPELAERRERLDRDLAGLRERAQALGETRAIAQDNAAVAAAYAEEPTADDGVNRRRASDAQSLAVRLAEVDGQLDANRAEQDRVRGELAAVERQARDG